MVIIFEEFPYLTRKLRGNNYYKYFHIYIGELKSILGWFFQMHVFTLTSIIFNLSFGLSWNIPRYFLEVLFYIGLKFKINQASKRSWNIIYKLLCKICINFQIDFFFYFVWRFIITFPKLFTMFFLLIINNVI